MAATPGAAVTGPKTRHDNLARCAAIDKAFRLTESPDLTHTDPGSGEQVIDVPVHFLRRGQMPADARLEVAQGAAGIKVKPGRKREFTEPTDTYPDWIGDLDQQLIGFRSIRTGHCRKGC